MKKSVAWTVTAALVISLGVFWFWRQSPLYAIGEFEKALRTKDLALFYSRIDLPGVHASAVDAMAIQALKKEKETPGIVDKVRAQISAGAEKLTAGQSIDLIKHEIELELRRDRNLSAPLDPALPKQTLRRLAHDIRNLEFLDWVESEDAVLLNVNLELLRMKTSYPLTLRFQRAEDRVWRLSGFEGLASLLSVYESDRAQKVLAHNEGIQKLLAENLPFFGETRLESADVGLSSTLFMDLLFHNKFEQAVKRVEGLITDGEDNPVIREPFDSKGAVISAGEKKVFLLAKAQFLNPAGPKSKGSVLKFEYGVVELMDGKIFTHIKDFDEITF